MSGGRGRKMEILMGSGSSKDSESGILSSERPQSDTKPASADDSQPPKRNESKDSGEDSFAGSSSVGRGKRQMMLQQLQQSGVLEEKEVPTTPDVPKEDTGVTRGIGRGEMQRRAIQAVRQYEPKQKPTVQTVTEQMGKVGLQEPLRETAPKKEPVLHRGKAGVSVMTACNYLPLKWKTSARIYEYAVNFQPPIDGIHLRVKIIHQLEDKIGGVFVFSGFNIFLPVKLEKVTTCKTVLATTKEAVVVTIKFVKEKPDEELSPFLNQLFNRIMKELRFVRYKRKQFDPTKAKIVPQHKLEIWPGYVTSVDTFEGGLMLNMDVSHRRLSRMTVLELMSDIHQKYRDADFHKQVKLALIGKVVLTRYNNETYTVHEVDFTLSPKDKFLRNGREIDYVDYYRRSYNITVKDLNQPLLINFKEVRVAGAAKKQERTTCLIPELCYLTGLTDAQMNNMVLKRELMAYTNVTPQHRVEGLRTFIENVRNCPAAKKVLADWGLELGVDALNIEARELGVQMIEFDGHRGSAGVDADFSRDATSKRVLHAVPIIDWVLVYSEKNKKEAMTLISLLTRNAHVIGMNVKDPTHLSLRNDSTGEFVRSITDAIATNPQYSIVVTIFPSQRGDLYASVKKLCCYQLPIPSQVVMAKTLGGTNESKTRSIVMKILLQMNCKVGGSLWSISIPMQGTMICGVDAYHDPSRKSPSVTGFVASTNKNFTKWFSTAIIQNISEEVSRGLGRALKEALEMYRETNGCLPDRIVFFRDGVGDGQLPLCENFEVPQLLSTASSLYPQGEVPNLTYVVTQKRINTRFFRQEDRGNNYKNCAPGTVIDHTITRRYMKDFFLISQHVRQGTVTPSHYIIVYDSANLSPDVVQKLAYRLTFMYYNWPGTIRVPACCQYAHKLANLVGEHVRKEPSKKLQDKLYYL